MKVLFASNAGGHLEELLHLSERLPFEVDESLWVTFDAPQSRSLLAGRQVQYVRYSAPRDAKATLANLAAGTGILARGRFDAAVSTGATVAVSFLPLAGVMGAVPYYIESAARLSGPSLTGRLLGLTPWVRLSNQCPRWAGGRWSFAGSVFDAFEPAEGANGGAGVRRIVVTVGASETYAFDRLVRALVPLFPPEAEVLWQTGCADVGGLGIPARRQVPAAELRQAVEGADVVVAHAGVGSALLALTAGKLPVLVPREAAHGEHVDDHQMQIAEDLAARGLAVFRRVADLSAEDLTTAASGGVRRVFSPPPLRLEAPSPSRRWLGGSHGRR